MGHYAEIAGRALKVLHASLGGTMKGTPESQVEDKAKGEVFLIKSNKRCNGNNFEDSSFMQGVV